MSLDNINLPAFIIQQLYKNDLVDINTADKREKKSGINFLGENNQRISIIVNNPGENFTSDNELTFLSGILNACKLKIDDIALINLAKNPEISYKKISDDFEPKIILMFGILPESIQLPFVIPQFQKQSYNSQIYLAAPSLIELENDKELKQKLWMNLKQIFSL